MWALPLVFRRCFSEKVVATSRSSCFAVGQVSRHLSGYLSSSGTTWLAGLLSVQGGGYIIGLRGVTRSRVKDASVTPTRQTGGVQFFYPAEVPLLRLDRRVAWFDGSLRLAQKKGGGQNPDANRT
jgi:hypothetical protein